MLSTSTRPASLKWAAAAVALTAFASIFARPCPQVLATWACFLYSAGRAPAQWLWLWVRVVSARRELQVLIGAVCVCVCVRARPLHFYSNLGDGVSGHCAMCSLFWLQGSRKQQQPLRILIDTQGNRGDFIEEGWSHTHTHTPLTLVAGCCIL